MPRRRARLYTLCISHPGLAVRAMLEHKGIDHDVVELWPGTHPLMLRVRGFTGSTAPALVIDGERFQDSVKIARALDRIAPDLPLLPAQDAAAVAAAERWGAEVLQDVPRRIFRWMCANDAVTRRWLADTAGVPAPGLIARDNLLARRFARSSGADERTVRADIAAIPMHLDYVADLLDQGVIGGEIPNAADFQIAAAVRSLQSMGDLTESVTCHPAGRWAAHTVGALPGPSPRALPHHWLLPLRTAPRARSATGT